jgi:hypothetical protein
METKKLTVVFCSVASSTGKNADQIARRMSANDEANVR